MKYIADLHVHSRYSMATSKNADLEGYYWWGRIKGIDLIGTGDFTHPGYFRECSSKLEQGEDGFFRLKEPPPVEAARFPVPGLVCRERDVRFCLSGEISSIYKKNGKTRKVHSLVFAPDLAVAAKIRARLDAIGNINSDGRPILGLDPKDLLEIILDISPRAHLIPAHVWTPWFSIFGSRSGFDSLEECFEDLSEYIFALETGLSSDPAMNWRWSALDRYALISNSDAHSPAKLGREANLFDTDFSYDALFNALKTRRGFEGTLEFFPQEGKYHLDGHRKCGVCLEPEETRNLRGLCPQCGKPLTVGVMHRVTDLADHAASRRPSGAADFRYLIPLPEIVAEILGVGPTSKKVWAGYASLLRSFGCEFELLLTAPPADIEAAAGPVYREAVHRMREKLVQRRPGYDGEFGVIKVFNPGEIEEFMGQGSLFVPDAGFGRSEGVRSSSAKKAKRQKDDGAAKADPGGDRTGEPQPQGLNAQQAAVAAFHQGVALVKAGPGTGKTRTLIGWISSLLANRVARAEEVLAISFTNKAAGEIRLRLAAERGREAEGVKAVTFHSFCFELLQEKDPSLQLVCGDAKRLAVLKLLRPGLGEKALRNLARKLQMAIENPALAPSLVDAELKRAYDILLDKMRAVDVADLIPAVNRIFSREPAFADEICRRYPFVAVDELQDINAQQFQLISILGRGRCLLGIGDPDQAIYGFRGAEVRLFSAFGESFQAEKFQLSHNYRSCGHILGGAGGLLGSTESSSPGLRSVRPAGARIRTLASQDQKEEAAFILEEIQHLMGGVTLHMMDSAAGAEQSYSFSDFAILARTRAVAGDLVPFFRQAGIPVGVRERRPLLEREPFTLVGSLFCCLLNRDDLPAVQHLLQELTGISHALLSPLADLFTETGSVSAAIEKGLLEGRLDASLPGRMEKVTAFLAMLEDRWEEGGISSILETIYQHKFAGRLDDGDEVAFLLLKETSESFSGDLAGFYRQVVLNPRESEYPYHTDKVNLLTFHAAKGLEFPVVFLVGAEEGISPLGSRDADPDEERRLFYVAMTRARDRLYITHLHKRRHFGRLEKAVPSRFLADLPAAHCRAAAGRKKELYEQPLLF